MATTESNNLQCFASGILCFYKLYMAKINKFFANKQSYMGEKRKSTHRNRNSKYSHYLVVNVDGSRKHTSIVRTNNVDITVQLISKNTLYLKGTNTHDK